MLMWIYTMVMWPKLGQPQFRRHSGWIRGLKRGRKKATCKLLHVLVTPNQCTYVSSLRMLNLEFQGERIWPRLCKPSPRTTTQKFCIQNLKLKELGFMVHPTLHRNQYCGYGHVIWAVLQSHNCCSHNTRTLILIQLVMIIILNMYENNERIAQKPTVLTANSFMKTTSLSVFWNNGIGGSLNSE